MGKRTARAVGGGHQDFLQKQQSLVREEQEATPVFHMFRCCMTAHPPAGRCTALVKFEWLSAPEKTTRGTIPDVSKNGQIYKWFNNGILNDGILNYGHGSRHRIWPFRAPEYPPRVAPQLPAQLPTAKGKMGENGGKWGTMGQNQETRRKYRETHFPPFSLLGAISVALPAHFRK